MTRREAFRAMLGLGVAATAPKEEPKPEEPKAYTMQWTFVATEAEKNLGNGWTAQFGKATAPEAGKERE